MNEMSHWTKYYKSVHIMYKTLQLEKKTKEKSIDSLKNSLKFSNF